MIQSNQSINQHIWWPLLGKPSISPFLYFLFIWIDSIMQIAQIRKSLNHLLNENELTHQSTITSLGKGTESIQSILREKWIDSNQSAQSSWLVYKSGWKSVPPRFRSWGQLPPPPQRFVRPFNDLPWALRLPHRPPWENCLITPPPRADNDYREGILYSDWH